MEQEDIEKKFSDALRKYLDETRQDCINIPRAEKHFKEQYAREKDPSVADRVERALGPVSGKRILDIGSGSGSYSVALALRGAVVSGVEPSQGAVDAANLRARRYPQVRAEFRVGVAERVPYADASFDAVVSFMVLEHVHDVTSSLREMFRVLKPGGVIYAETVNSNYPREEHYRIFWFPHMPKSLGKLYARLRGKQPEFLDQLNHMYRGRVLRMLNNIGFRESRELYRDYVFAKITSGVIHSPLLASALTPIRAMGLATVFGNMVAAFGIYPALWLWAKK